ncbi:MAG TPA: DUF4426 domain-containing protein [Gammaproteobacteria bacterium]|nr:DUF4426 domain-containing protein [Gammaproteobacteria bacterium]
MAGLRTTAIITAFSLTACGQSQAPNAPLEEDGTMMTAAEPYRDFGAWSVHINAQVTNKLSAEIAAQYGIARSNTRAMLNVSVVRDEPVDGSTGMRAAIDVSARNLSGQVRNLTMREIAEGSAIYYIGETAVSNAETLVFTISVTPEGESTQTLRYMQQFFID